MLTTAWLKEHIEEYSEEGVMISAVHVLGTRHANAEVDPIRTALLAALDVIPPPLVKTPSCRTEMARICVYFSGEVVDRAHVGRAPRY